MFMQKNHQRPDFLSMRIDHLAPANFSNLIYKKKQAEAADGCRKNVG